MGELPAAGETVVDLYTGIGGPVGSLQQGAPCQEGAAAASQPSA
jgi:hypothetical protein